MSTKSKRTFGESAATCSRPVQSAPEPLRMKKRDDGTNAITRAVGDDDWILAGGRAKRLKTLTILHLIARKQDAKDIIGCFVVFFVRYRIT